MSSSEILKKLRPGKVRRALHRRWFERAVPHMPLSPVAGGIEDVGTETGGWIVPPGLIEPGWTCYCVGAGGDIAFDVALARRFEAATVRSFDPVEAFVDAARQEAAGEPRMTAHHAALAVADGPLKMQLSHHPGSSSVSSAELYETASYVELPGRSLPSLMRELGDERIDLLKLDIEGAEYEVVPTLDLLQIGVRVLCFQLHANGTVAEARTVIAGLRAAGYEPVGCRPAVKLTFVAGELLADARAAGSGDGAPAV